MTRPAVPPVDIDAYRRAEAALRARELELSQLVDMVPSHLWRLTPDGEPTFFNRRMVDFLELDVTDTDKPGMTRLEAMIEAAVHPDDAAAFEDTLRCSLATGMSFSMRYRLRRGDGVYRWMSSRAEPMRDQNGRIIQWYGLCHDIHDQMQADEALRRSQRQLQQMIDAVPVRIWSTPPAGGPVYFNKRYKDHLRSVVPDFDSIEEPRFDQLLQGLVHPVDAPAVWGALRNSFEAGEGCVLRFRWREKDGVYRWAECRVEPWCDQSGAIVQWYGVSLDIDDEVRAREALRRSERELSQLLDMVPVHIRRLTPEGEVTYFNKRTADFLGMDLAQLRRLGGGRALVTQQIQDFIHPDDAASLLETVCRALAAGEGWVARYRLRRTDGVYRWVEGRAEPLREQDGAISQYFTATIDIDDYMRVQQAEDALRQASAKLALATRSASLAELSASIAHEVNQPLAAIVANSHACHRWLSAESPNIDRAKVTLERIIRDANAAADVVTRIRALFRHVPHAKSPEDVNRLIGEVCRLMADEIRAKDIRVRTSLDPDLPTVALDRVQVQQVLVNLIRNGIEAMDGVIERALEICSCRDGIDAVRIEVRDAGTGFGDLERAFEPFFTTKESGMGMGLPICRSIVESHGGRLWVANNEARGATVAFALPLAASEAP